MSGRSRAELAAKNNPQLADRSWQVWKTCEYCGRSICINNYDDRKSRTPRFLGMVICVWCDPRVIEDRWLWRDTTSGAKPRIAYPMRYRTVICTYLVRIAAKDKGEAHYSTIQKKALEFFDGQGKPHSLTPMVIIPTSATDEEIYH